jgi:GxxExxY protein
MEIDEITGEIVDASLKLHRALGPGLLESVYEVLLAKSLQRRGLHVERQKLVSFEYDGIRFDGGFRIDMLVARCVVVEVKSVESVAKVHMRQVLTYIRLMDLRVGLLVNFGGATLKAGLHRIVNSRQLPSSAIAGELGGSCDRNALPGGGCERNDLPGGGYHAR